MNEELTKFHKAYTKLKKLEFGDKANLFLHQNQNEDFLTLGGCYEKWHKDKIDWHFVHNVLSACNGDKKRASELLYYDSRTRAEVAQFFKFEFWDKMKLDEVQSQKICNEIFLSGVHIGIRNAIKLAQKQIGVLEDGIIGNITLKALNAYDERRFDREFDTLEIENYYNMIHGNPKLAYARDGFVNRSLSE